MDIINIFIAIATSVTVFLGFFVLIKDRKKEENFAFLLITLAIALWSMSMILFRIAEVNSSALLWGRMLYYFGLLISPTFLYFVLAFVKRESISKILKFLLFGSSFLILSLFLVKANVLIESVRIRISGESEFIFGWGIYLYIAYVLSLFTLGVARLFVFYGKSIGIYRLQVRYVLIGATIPIAIGSVSNILLPSLFGVFSYNWLANITVVIMPIFFTYAIVRHHLMVVRVIATELFTALILLVILLDMLVSSSWQEFIFRSAMFIVVLIFGIFLIRGTIREIRGLERLSKAKSDFVSIVSHQLRTPLTAIKGFVSMIQEGSGTEEDRKDWLKKTYVTNERMIRLVNDILNVSRIERGKLQYNFKNLDILELIEGVITEVRMQAEAKGIVLNWERPAEDMPEVRADEEKLRQVILNIIDNAIKYTEKGHINVRLKYLKDLRRINIIVQDTGIGITREDLKGLFEQFSRGEGGQKTNVEGMGLGLYVAQSIVRAHNGKIWAESEGLHRGSRFYIELPVA